MAGNFSTTALTVRKSGSYLEIMIMSQLDIHMEFPCRKDNEGTAF